MRRNTFALIQSCLLLAFAACTQQQQAAKVTSSSTDVVRATTSPVEIAAGGSADATVRVQVASGYHINANPPTYPYLIATELNVEPGEGITAGKPVYPASLSKKFPFAEKPLAVYEGNPAIKVPLSAADSASKGAHTLRAKLRVQACDDKACYPPGTLDAAVQVTVK